MCVFMYLFHKCLWSTYVYKALWYVQGLGIMGDLDFLLFVSVYFLISLQQTHIYICRIMFNILQITSATLKWHFLLQVVRSQKLLAHNSYLCDFSKKTREIFAGKKCLFIVMCFYLIHSWQYQLKGQGLLGRRFCSSSSPNTNGLCHFVGG